MADHNDTPEQPPSAAAPSTSAPLVDLQIVSPSVGVNGPLRFTGLSANTTVAELKQKIRETLAGRPTNEAQRLIYSGRLLARDADTLADFFGEQKIRGNDILILHLVLRDPNDFRHGSASLPHSRASSPAPGMTGRAANYDVPPTSLHQHHRIPRSVPTPIPQAPSPQLNGDATYQLPQGTNTQMQQAQLLMAQQHAQHLAREHQQNMLQWMHQAQRDGTYRNLVAQGQQARAAMGMHGIQDEGAHQGGTPTPGLETGEHGRPGPGQHTTTVHEGIQNGRLVRITMNETVINSPGAAHVHGHGMQLPFPQPGTMPVGYPGPGHTQDGNAQVNGHGVGFHAPNIPHNGDAQQQQQQQQGLAEMQVAEMLRRLEATGMRRTVSNASHSSFNPTPQRSTSQAPAAIHSHQGPSRPASRVVTPDSSASHGIPPQQQAHPQATTSANAQPELYILSSPEGPRALLINNNDLYYSSSMRLPAQMQQMMAIPPFMHAPILHPASPYQPHQIQTHPQPFPFTQNAGDPAPGIVRAVVRHDQGQAAPPQAEAAVPAPAQAAAVVAEAAQPQAQAQNADAGAIMLAAWPHIWLLFRLMVFIWWFTSSNTSWLRWITIVTLATVIFVLNTGMLNVAGNALWDPIRQHIQDLMPADLFGHANRDIAAVPAHALAPQAPGPAVQTQTPAQAQAPPNPAQTAARLVAQRRHQNGDWLMTHIRRIERAALLFVASALPGIAEGHIARLEAQEREERARREADAAAQRTAEAAAAAARMEDEARNTAQAGDAPAAVAAAAVEE